MFINTAKLQEEMIVHGFNHTSLSERADISLNTINRIFKLGRAQMSTVMKITQALQIKPSQLFDIRTEDRRV